MHPSWLEVPVSDESGDEDEDLSGLHTKFESIKTTPRFVTKAHNGHLTFSPDRSIAEKPAVKMKAAAEHMRSEARSLDLVHLDNRWQGEFVKMLQFMESGLEEQCRILGNKHVDVTC